MRSLIFITIAFVLLLVVSYDAVAFILGDLHWINQVWSWSQGDRFLVVMAVFVLGWLAWAIGASL